MQEVSFLIKENRSLGVLSGSVRLADELEEVKFKIEINEENVAGKKEFIAKGREGLVAIGIRAPGRAISEPDESGSVVWQKIPGTERMDAVGLSNANSRTEREGSLQRVSGSGRISGLYRFGMGAYPGTGKPDLGGKTLADIISDPTLPCEQRGMAAAILAAPGLLHNKPPNFIGRLSGLSEDSLPDAGSHLKKSTILKRKSRQGKHLR
jgi:hypothetical protein